MSDDIENYTTERTIAFFAIGDEHYVTKNLARAIAADLESKVKRIAELESELRWLKSIAFVDINNT